MQKLITALLMAAALSAGCASPSRYDDGATARAGYGTVQSVAMVERNSPGMVGAIAGGVIGGLVGHQFGSGRGQTAATIGGAAGGAYIGHEIATRRANEVFKVDIRMDDGWNQTLAMDEEPGVHAGDRVYVDRRGVLRRD